MPLPAKFLFDGNKICSQNDGQKKGKIPITLRRNRAWTAEPHVYTSRARFATRARRARKRRIAATTPMTCPAQAGEKFHARADADADSIPSRSHETQSQSRASFTITPSDSLHRARVDRFGPSATCTGMSTRAPRENASARLERTT